MSSYIFVALVVALWVAAVALWVMDTPDPRSRVDLILNDQTTIDDAVYALPAAA